MADYHFHTSHVKRSDGRSAVAAAAYRAADRLVDESTGRAHNYRRKQGVEHTEILLPPGVTAMSRAQLWNWAEAAEKRCDARVAREFELSLPHELSIPERIELAREFAQLISLRFHVAVDIAIHQPNKRGDWRNWHAHLLVPTRAVLPDGRLGEKTDLELNDTARKAKGLCRAREEITWQREQWATMCNQALARANCPARVDHRTLAAQRADALERGDLELADKLDREPTQKMGPRATEMEREREAALKKGETERAEALRTDRGDLNRLIRQNNAERFAILQWAKKAWTRAVDGWVHESRWQIKERWTEFKRGLEEAFQPALGYTFERCQRLSRTRARDGPARGFA